MASSRPQLVAGRLFQTLLVLSALASAVTTVPWVRFELLDRRVSRQVADCVPEEAGRLRQAFPGGPPGMTGVPAVGETISWDDIAARLAWYEDEARKTCGVPSGSSGTRTWDSPGEDDLLGAAIVLLPFILLGLRRWVRWLVSTAPHGSVSRP